MGTLPACSHGEMLFAKCSVSGVLVSLSAQAFVTHSHATSAWSSAHSGKCCSSCHSEAGWVLEQLSLGGMGEAELCACECQRWRDSKCATEGEIIHMHKDASFQWCKTFSTVLGFPKTLCPSTVTATSEAIAGRTR